MKLGDIEVKTIDGRTESMSRYLGNTLLVVNVASECGYTPQYEGLERLYRAHQGRGLVVLGFPCDQFGNQEPGDDASIREFCTVRYNVTFPLYSKIEVNGERTHPLYAFLKSAKPGILGSEAIKWNFTKFLVAPGGEVEGRFAPQETPEEIEGKILAVLDRGSRPSHRS